MKKWLSLIHQEMRESGAYAILVLAGAFIAGGAVCSTIGDAVRR